MTSRVSFNLFTRESRFKFSQLPSGRILCSVNENDSDLQRTQQERFPCIVKGAVSRNSAIIRKRNIKKPLKTLKDRRLK